MVPALRGLHHLDRLHVLTLRHVVVRSSVRGGYGFLLLYIDDIILTASSTRLLDQITASLRSEFAMTDMGSLHYFLGIAVTRDSSSMHLSQAKYAAEILDNTDMTACKSATTPIVTTQKL
jgi:hypothetical protein